MVEHNSQHYMQLAINLAQRGVGRTAPNPPVGAVIVKDDKIVGEGFHPYAGAPHAEIFALRQAGKNATGASIYVTLEPCSHYGKTPPCADALINAGIEKVYIGVADPNPQVAGNGIRKLENAGIAVQVGLLTTQVQRLIKPFHKLITTGKPYTIYKSAVTLDGNTATYTGDSCWVSGVESRMLVHRLRDRVEAIMVGIETVISDDPLLNTRLPDGNGCDPLRVVVDSHLRLDPKCRLLQQKSDAKTVIATISTSLDKISALQVTGVEIITLPPVDGRVSLPDLWNELGSRGVQRLLLEGGSTLAKAAFDNRLIDQMMLFVAPKLVGGTTAGIFSGCGCSKMSLATELSDVNYQPVGEDLLITGEIDSCLPD